MLSGILLLLVLLQFSSSAAFHSPDPSHTTPSNRNMLSTIRSCRGTFRTPGLAFTRVHRHLPLQRMIRPCSASTSSATSLPGVGTIGEDDVVGNVTGFHKLGLLAEIADTCRTLGYTVPTPVQKTAIPRLLQGQNLALAAATGSGKTLGYLLPIFQALKLEEAAETAEDNRLVRQNQRPRCVILVPTRDLARQVLSVIKDFSHHLKLSSCGVLGGEDFAAQKKRLQGANDIVVASPGRLRQHKEKSNVFLSRVKHVVIDEVDTMLTQGFGEDLQQIIQAVYNTPEKRQSVRLLMATATVSKAVRRLLDSEFDPDLSEAKNMKLPNPNKLPTDFQPATQKSKGSRIPLKILEVSGLHRSLPAVRHDMLDTKGADKLETLLELVNGQKKEQTIIFCNTVTSSSAVEHALKNHGISSTLYNGEMNSKAREASLQQFRDGEVRYLVCTDIASRGLDIPDVKHVIMFDFPRNSIDYLHRAGRTGRAGAEGKVTSILQRRDLVLGEAIKAAIQKGLPLDNLSANKMDYAPEGKLSGVRKLTSLKGKHSSRKTTTTATPQGGKVRKAASQDMQTGRGGRGSLKARPGSVNNPIPPGRAVGRRASTRRKR